MNDRIKELALRANMEYDIFLPDAWTGESEDLEKFAELLIKECGIIADKYKDEHLFTFPSEEMKQHFGVEL